ncbi:MAG: type I DNA topoisomerase [Chloroflexota bacterium]|nr:type I DNA topoisomerase [Chloroflexota bacterium]
MAQRRKTPSKRRSRPAPNLVIVESGTKAQTIKRYLGRDFDVLASVGHVRDLPKGNLGVDIENDFAPTYVVPRDKQKTVTQIRKAAAASDSVLLATDPDREGEAIAWHLMAAADLDEKKTSRVRFHEITKSAVQDALNSPEPVDDRLVEAQQARRVLDRLVGFKISPILRRRIPGGSSAGRVQSVALRIVVDRERQRREFVPEEWWTVDGQFGDPGTGVAAFTARLHRDGKELRLDAAAADALLDPLGQADYQVTDRRQNDRRLRPQAPFTTASLQRAASNRLGLSPSQTMRIAQRLYEGVRVPGRGQIGLITYMRTDSVSVSGQALDAVRGYVRTELGEEFLPARPNSYKTRTRNAQEAHEAIRPTEVALSAAVLGDALDSDQRRLYDLIWRQFVASQMVPGAARRLALDVAAGPDSETAFRVTASRVIEPGCLQVASYGPRISAEESARFDYLTQRAVGDPIELLQIESQKHASEPPPRYTEAGLIKVLEDEGIGRPSTYAAIIRTLKDRQYVSSQRRVLEPTQVGEFVTDAMAEFFADIVDVAFTARMETELDRVASGELGWVDATGEFWERLDRDLANAWENLKKPVADELLEEECPRCSRQLVKRLGRNGVFVGCSGFPECRFTRDLEDSGNGEESTAVGEPCPDCGSDLVYKQGRFGRFIGCESYPDCRYTRQITEPTGVQCPDCGEGQLVVKKTRRGRTFFGCERYPACEYSTWQDPRQQPAKPAPAKPADKTSKGEPGGTVVGECPRCGKELGVKRGRYGEFVGCSGFPGCRFTGKIADYVPAESSG